MNVEDEPERGGDEHASAPVEHIGRYVLREVVGEGDGSVVLRAYDPRLRRDVALRCVGEHMSEVQVSRLMRETKACARLSHPNVVQIYEAVVERGQGYLAMELVEGEPLRTWQRGRSWAECVGAYMQVARGLAAAHAIGVVHGDFTPSNCRVDTEGRVRVMSLHRRLMADESRTGPSVLDAAEGTLWESLGYSSPEECLGEPLGQPSDVYGFCVALYEAVYRELPFAGRSLGELSSAKIQGRVREPPGGCDVPRWLRRVFLRGLETDPRRRHPSMTAVIEALEGQGRLLHRWFGGAVPKPSWTDELAPRNDIARDVDESQKVDSTLMQRHMNELMAKLITHPLERPRLGRYVLGEELGKGAMGTVHAAWDDVLERSVAIKRIEGTMTWVQRQRMFREARAMARLSHPNIVQIYDIDSEADQMFIAMELVDGQTLRQWERAGPSWRECVGAYVQAARGLATAHAEGLTHRDFKPHNCIIDGEGRVRVLDFGLVREEGSPEEQAELLSVPSWVDSGGDLTKTGALVGTPLYMSPEQLRGKRADARSDQYGFCVSLYEAVYDDQPFPTSSWQERERAMRAGRVCRAPRHRRVPRRLRRVLLRGLAPAPDDRWPSMEALERELLRMLAPPRIRW